MSTPRIAVVDYGIGNLRSAEKALQHLHAECCFEILGLARGSCSPGGEVIHRLWPNCGLRLRAPLTNRSDPTKFSATTFLCEEGDSNPHGC